MSLSDSLDSLLIREKKKMTKPKLKRLKMYSTGLKGKVKQIDYCLAKMEEFYELLEESRDYDNLSTKELIELYNDSFWTFLYSLMDITGQIVNQSLSLQIKEKDVSFWRVSSLLSKNFPHHPATKQISIVFKTRAYKNTWKYRNCSIHRRPIYIEHKLTETDVTAAYRNSTGPIRQTERHLCDNPLDFNPKTHQNRNLLEYTKKSRDNIEGYIIKIIKELP